MVSIQNLASYFIDIGYMILLPFAVEHLCEWTVSKLQIHENLQYYLYTNLC